MKADKGGIAWVLYIEDADSEDMVLLKRDGRPVLFLDYQKAVEARRAYPLSVIAAVVTKEESDGEAMG